MRNNVAAVLLALLAGNVTVFASELVTHQLFPLDVDPSTASEHVVREAIMRLPPSAFIVLMTGWALAALLEGIVAAKISKDAKIACALIAGGVQTVGCIINLVNIPHPTWFWASALVFVPFAWLGAHVVLRRLRDAPR